MALRNLLPVELLILLCLLFLTLFVVVALFLYSRRRQSIVRATSNLQIKDTSQNVVLPVLDLLHPPNCLQFTHNRSEVSLRLVEVNLYGNLFGRAVFYYILYLRNIRSLSELTR